MREDIIKRLEWLGYSFSEDKDGWILEFVIDKVTNTIKNETNLAEIPQGLHQITVDMTCAEFLKAKKASGDLDGFIVDLNETMLSKESQGDTSFSWGTDKVMSSEERLNYIIEHLLNYGKPQFLAFRRFRW